VTADTATALLAPLLSWDASGRTWLDDLLRAAPRASVALRGLPEPPGWLVTPLAVPTADGRLGAFTYIVPPPRSLLAWLIEHPDELRWPAVPGHSREAEVLRRALIDDMPPGSRGRAQERARELVATGALAPAWWRFEEPFALEAALITDRIVITVGTGDPHAGVNPWFPARTRLVRVLEAAGQLAEARRTATLWLGEGPDPDVDALAAELAAGAPHLEPEARRALADGYLGTVGTTAAETAVADPLARARHSRRHGKR
jgi:hypothetical protein